MPPATEPMILPRQFLRMCRRNRKRLKVADSTGAKLTGGHLLLRTLVLRRILAREVLADDEKHVGLLLPPSAGGVVANAVLPLMLVSVIADAIVKAMGSTEPRRRAGGGRTEGLGVRGWAWHPEDQPGAREG